MLLFDALNFLAGYRELSCSAEDAVGVMNLLHNGDFDYWDAKRIKDGDLTFCLLEKEYRRFVKESDEVSHHTVRRKGLPVLLSRYRRRVGLLIGLLVFVFLTSLSTRYVWEVTVSGNETLTDAEVMACLEDLGCGVGTYIPSVDFYEICHRFLLEKEEVSWISVNMVGTTARVELIESETKGNVENGGNGTPSNLIAERDGVVVRTETASGKLSVKAGDAVKKGQLLGQVGDTALMEIADEPHLHMEMTVKGLQVDPMDYFSQAVIASLSKDTAFEEEAGK
jgi:similar to stage IV sporulation protein